MPSTRFILQIAELIVAILLMTAILIQNKGAGLGEVMGGSGAIFTTKRGAEKRLHQITIALSILFFGIAFVIILLQ